MIYVFRFLFVCIVAVIVAAGTGMWWFLGPGRYGELNDIKEHLASIPGVKVIKIGGNEDLTFEDIYAQVEIDGVVITFDQLTSDSFKNPDSIQVSRVGPYIPTTRGCYRLQHSRVRNLIDGSKAPQRFYGSYFDIGSAGEFGNIAPLPYKNVQDVLARSRELGEILHSWPTVPDEKYVERSTKVYTYWVRIAEDAKYDGPWKDALTVADSSEKARTDLFGELHDPQWEQYCTAPIDG